MATDPLTHANRQGRVYAREPDVEIQISQALALEEQDLITRARLRDYRAPGYLKSECLVYLIRHYEEQQRTTLVNDLTEVLSDRISRYARRHMVDLELEDPEDCYADVVAAVFERVLDFESDRGDFAQVRFYLFVDAIQKTVLRRYRQLEEDTAQSIPWENIAGYAEQDEDEEPVLYQGRAPAEEAAGQVAHRNLLTSEALALLEEPIRTAFLLRHYFRWPIEDSDPRVPTISRYFHKTAHTIRNWLKAAEERLREWREADHG